MSAPHYNNSPGYHMSSTSGYQQQPSGTYRISGTSNVSGHPYGAGNRAPSVAGLSGRSGASATSFKSMASEYQQKQTHKKLNEARFGPGKTPFRYGIVAAIIGVLFLIAGLTLFILQKLGRTAGMSDREEFIGPLLIVVGIIAFMVAGWFWYTARKKSNAYRQRLRFKPNPVNSEKVSVVNIAYEPDNRASTASGLKSGTVTDRAVSQISYTSSNSNTLSSRGPQRGVNANPMPSPSQPVIARGPLHNNSPAYQSDSRPASVHSNTSIGSLGVHPAMAMAFQSQHTSYSSNSPYTEPKDTAL